MGIEVLISVLVIFCIAAIAIYLIDWVGLPIPINKIAKVIVVLIALVSILKYIPGVF